MVLALLQRRWSSAGFGTFEKIKFIFSIAPVGNLEKLRVYRTLVLAAPDAGLERPVWCQSVAQVCRMHRTHRSVSGAQRPVCGRFGDPLCA